MIYNEENGIEYLDAFVIRILRVRLELDIDSLIEFCYEMKRKDGIGVEVSNVGGWQSGDIFKETHTEFVKLKHTIEECANIFHHDMQFKNTHSQKIDNIWANINQKGHSNEWHVHPKSSFSGAFYLKGSSPIVFKHPYPDITLYYWDKPFIEEWNGFNSGESSLEPSPNTLIIFPPWLSHKVLMNKEDTDRITFSFNTSFKKWEQG